MKWYRYYPTLILSLPPVFLSAQAIDNTLSYRNIQSDRYFRIYYENDYFTGTDRDYTQGIYIELVNPSLRNSPLSKLLWRPPNSEYKYGLAIEDDCYTPLNISSPAIQYGDRPFAGALFLKSFLTAINCQKKERITTLLISGVIGPEAGGEAMQKGIHHLVSYNNIPQGWNNQIKSDLALNYQLNYERELLAYKDYFSLGGIGSARMGTLSTKATAGLTIQAGDFYSPYQKISNAGTKKFQWYIYAQPLVNAVGYDATLQGGLFNRTSPYTISDADMSRLTLQYRLGFVIVLRRMFLEYYRTGITKEFSTEDYHRTGGLQIGFGFHRTQPSP